MMTKERLLATQQIAKDKMKELRAQAQVRMTYELENELDMVQTTLGAIEYALDSIAHYGVEEVNCLIEPDYLAS